MQETQQAKTAPTDWPVESGSQTMRAIVQYR